MERKRYGFSGGPYRDEQGGYLIEGSFIIIPKGSAECAAPEYTILSAIFNATDQVTGDPVFFSDRQVYILIKESVAAVGDIMNQHPLPYNHPFYFVLKEIVIAEYLRVKK
ncbi:MAG: hypothetical protein JWM28_3888 [Chitinophagaceae bacterium]|nr:hypothetical protein [Chitinophagaceae bacterium]